MEIDRVRSRLSAIQPQLGDETALKAPRAAVEEHTASRSGLRMQQKDMEMDIAPKREKLGTLERKMYGGSVGNPRELEGMRKEAGLLRQSIVTGEDRLLELMVTVEEAQAALAVARKRLRQAEEEWQKTQESLKREQEALEKEMAALLERREAVAPGIPATELALYEQVRKARGGLAVAKVERGMCQGCRLALPSSELQRVRASPQPVRCSSCGRILYLS